MAVVDAKNTIPEDAQTSFVWCFVEDTFLKKFETIKPNYFQAETIETDCLNIEWAIWLKTWLK